MIYVTSTRHQDIESLGIELDKINKEYGNYSKVIKYIDWTQNTIYYTNGDPLQISFRNTIEYDY